MTNSNYSKTLDELYQLQQFSIKQGLENISFLAKKLGDPHLAYPVIHIAGTNGKGSTSSMLQQILTAHGLRVGLYTSPHLIDFRERITVNSNKIDPDYITDYWRLMAPVVTEMKATFFDTTTALAFKYFQDQKVNVAVIETGLGGRLDSTNIVRPDVVILTPIHRDHTKQLGRRLGDIAREKAEIIKQGTTVFCARQHKHVRETLSRWQSRASQWYDLDRVIQIGISEMTTTGVTFDLKDKANDCRIDNLQIAMSGKHQAENASLAYLAARWYMQNKRIRFSEPDFRKALVKAVWPGRFQKISDHPEIIFDVSHNYDGFRKTMKLIAAKYQKEKSYLLIGLIADKEYGKIAEIIHNRFAEIIVTEPAYARALPAEKMASALRRFGILPVTQKDYRKAYEKAKDKLSGDDTLFVMGSHYLIGALLSAFNKST